VGALTFYFREPGELCEADRSLLRLVADQMAATAEKAHLIEDLQKANQRLRKQNVELEARYRQAEEARRLKNEFLANVSHELRTPLTAILGFAYLLREGIPGTLEGEQAAAVEKIEAAGATLMGLINDLLDLTHLRLGRTTVELEECDAVALAHAALSSVNPPTGAVEVSCELPDVPVPALTDPVIAVRILQNLLSNAFKFTAAGSVTLRLSALPAPPPSLSEQALGIDGGVVLWEVEDTGIGIEESDFDIIFDEFRQVDGSATRRYGGTGMGLALSLGLARRLGGDIAVRSTPGQGSVFTLVLPARGPAARTAPIEIRLG
jgi:signal transduction histidine kinase